MSFLLPTLVLLVASTAALLATRLWKARKRLGSRAGVSRRSRVALGAPGSGPAEQSPPQGPAAPRSPLYIPCGCGPGCGPCAAAARELQDLVTPLWPGVSFPQDSEMWQLVWEDLEQLLERGCLSCCTSSSSSGSSRGHSRSWRQTSPLIHQKTSAAGKGSELQTTQHSLRCSTVPRTSIPQKGSPIPIQTTSDLRCAPTGTRPAPAKKAESWSHWCPTHGSQDPAAEPSGQTLRTLLDKRLQQQRQLVPCSGSSLEVAGKDKEDLHTWDVNSQGQHRCQSLHDICWTPDGAAHRDTSSCSLGAMAMHRTHQIPTDRKSLEIQLGAQAIPARHFQPQVAQQDGSLSRCCPWHSSQDTGAVAREKTLRAVLDRRLQRQRKHPPAKGALGRWLARLRMQLMASTGALRRVLCAA